MRKLLLTALFLLFPLSLLAAESVVQSVYTIAEGQYCLEFNCTTASNGSLTNTKSTYPINGLVYLIETIPGTTTPTASYDITVLTDDGLDIAGGNAANRSASVVERVPPLNYQAQSVKGYLTLHVTNNSVNSAKFKVRVYFFR